MSVWKSPIFYVGIVLVLFVAGLLSAPFVVDWNAYRASIEDYGSRLTGRQVVVSGDVSVWLFPWPTLRLERVRIANPPGAANSELVDAEAIEARMLLGSLISGYVEVSDIRVEKPVFALERLESGEASWWLSPQLEGGIPIGAERISVEDLEIVDGKIFLSDSRRGGTAQFEDFDAQLSSQTLLGPWKAKGQLRRNGQVLSIGVTTGKHKPDEPFNFVVKLSPVEGPGLVYSFDGQYWSKGQAPVSGILRAEPFVDESGKSDSEAQIRAVTFKAQLSFKEDHALLQDIEIAPVDREQMTNLLTGNAAIELDSRISVMADLRAPKFDLDDMLGSEGRQVLKSGTMLEALSQFVDLLPETMDGRLILDVGTLIAGGEKLEGTRLEAELAEGGLIVHELKATMPGQTKGRFSGLLFASEDKPQLSGDLEIESGNTREFVSWLMPEWKEMIADRWNGARGKLSLRSKVNYGPLSISLVESRISLDESLATGEISLAGGEQAKTDIRLVVDRLDFDRYLTEAFGPSDGTSKPGVRIADLAGAAGKAGALGDIRLAVRADNIVLNGVEAHNVMADVAVAGNAVEIRDLEIGNVGDAKVDASGVLKPENESGTGSATVKVDADDPRPLLRLLGIIPPATLDIPEPAWAGELKPLRATLNATLDKRDAESAMHLTIGGVAGGSNIALDLTYMGALADFRLGRLSLAGGITGLSSKKLAAFFGMDEQASSTDAAKLSVEAEGELQNGLRAKAEVAALGARATFEGRLVEKPGKAGWRAEGQVIIDATDGDRFLKALAISSPVPGAPLKVASDISLDLVQMEFTNLNATIGNRQFDAHLAFGKGEFDVVARAAEISLPWLLSLALMPSDGRPVTDVTLFAEKPLAGAKGTIAIDADRMALVRGIFLTGSNAKITSDGNRMQVSVLGSGARGVPFRMTADAKRETDELRLKGTIEGSLELGELLSAPDGEPVIDSRVTFKSQFAGAGRSPSGLASSLSGSGEVSMPNGFVRGIDAQTFISGLTASPTSTSIEPLLRRGFTGSDLIFSGGSGSIRILDGIATMGPVAFEAGDIKGSIKTIVELLTSKVDLSVEVGLKSLHAMPPVEVAYAGLPDQLERTIDASELKARLSAAELKENMEKLEELQREQMELFAEDDRQRRMDVEQQAEVEALQRRSLENRQRVEIEVLANRAEQQRQAQELALQLERDELKRKAEVIEQQRRTEAKKRLAELVLDRKDLQSRAEETGRQRQTEAAARQRAEDQRKVEEERLRLAAEEAARKAEEERQRLAVEEAARKAEEQRQRLAAEEAARKAEEERQRLAAEEAARKAEEERQRLAAEEAVRKAEEERQRLAAEEAARKAEEERLRLAAEEAARKAEEERQRLAAEEAARKAEEERQRLAAEEAARKAEEERLRMAEEAARKAEEQKRQARERLAREMALRDINVRELMQQSRRVAAWNFSAQRARELAARKALEDAQAKIEELLRSSEANSTGTLAQEPTVESNSGATTDTRSITSTIPSRTIPDIPPPEPLPVEEGDASTGPTLIDPSSTATESVYSEAEVKPPQTIVPQQTRTPSLLQRLLKVSPAKKRPPPRKRYNFNQ